MDLETGFRRRRVLVTGGAGFVGSNAVRRLAGLGAEVTVLDNLETGSRENLPPSVRFIQGDVENGELVSRLVAEVEVVLHLAARNIIVSTHDPRSDFSTNIGGTLNVLLAARQARLERVVYSSSASVYGNSRYLPANEDDPPNLLSPYAVSKFAGESYCRAFYESYEVPTCVVRYSNVYGPGQNATNPYCGVIAKFFDAALNGRPMSIHGDGLQTRDFTFVEDAVEATLLASLRPRAVGEVFNVATGVETSITSMAKTILEVSGRSARIEHLDRRDIDNIRRRVVSIEKIRQALHWVPRFTLTEGLTRTWAWLAAVAEPARSRRD
jgi:nucleoside-diphosphate-sugar epimerase